MSLSSALAPAETTSARAAAAPPRSRAHPIQGAAAFFADPLTPILTTLGVVVLVVLAVAYARSAGVVAALWGAGGLAVAAWLRSGRGVSYDLCFGGLLTVGIFGAELLVGNDLTLSLLFTAANMVEIVGGVLLARRFAPTLNLASVRGAGRFLVFVAALAPVPAALLATIGLYVAQGADPIGAFGTWWLGHALGLAVIGGFGVSVTPRHAALLRQPLRALEAVVLFGVVCGAAWLIFVHYELPLAFSLYPLLLLVAARLRVLGIMAALVVVAVLAVGGAMIGRGVYAGFAETLTYRAILAQMLVLFGYLPILMVASLLEERDRLTDRARAGQRRAELASEAKSRLLANVAHEIKSPVAGVIGIGELWKAGSLGPVSAQQADMADMLVKTARQVESLSHDLLDVARAESGAVKVDLRPTDVPGVLEDCRRALILRPEARGLRVETVAEGDGLIALADSQRLSQIVANLASNALKYAHCGGVVILRAVRIYDGVRIEVIDRGPGLSPEKQAQLFEPFNRLGLERSAVEGHGIGLALSKRLVELQGGSIGVDSTPGQGATFWVELPAA